MREDKSYPAVPEGWEQTEIETEFELFVGGDVDKEHFSFIRTSKYKYPIYANALQNDGIYGYTSFPKYNRNSITITGRGDVGKSMYRSENFDAIVRLLVLTPKANAKVMSKFAYYFINQCVEFPMESTGVPQLTVPQIRNIKLMFPPLPEQHAIAETLSDMDAYIDSLEKLIAKKKAIKQGAMQELLTGKRRLPGFDGEWVEKSLDALFDFSGGISASRAELSSSGYPYLHYGDIHGSSRTFIDVCKDDSIPCLDISLDKVSNSALLKDGDVVFVDASEDDEGASRYIVIRNNTNRGFISGLHTIVAKSKTDELDDLFKEFCFLTEAIKLQFKFYAVGTKVTGVNKVTIKKISLRFPVSKSEQTAIAAVLSDMDAEIEALSAKLNKAKAIKQGMMQELLTGRIRLVKPKATAIPVTKIIEFPKNNNAAKGHNQAIEDAVILGVITDLYATEQYPLAPFYAQKLPYLLHRHMEGKAQGFKKKAAGPYNSSYKYKTALPIALKNKYVVGIKAIYKGTNYLNLVSGSDIDKAKRYFIDWHGEEPLKWLEQFKYIKNRRDELELLATVDMAMVELRNSNKPITVSAVKEIIENSDEWKAKLKREIFSDKNISRAINWSINLFGKESPNG
jgi:type I restriction enzyme S subunit